MNKDILHIYNLIQELSWHFGNHGFNGECCGDLSLVEFMVLKKVHDSNNITIQEIGNHISFSKSGASKIIDRLENKGYVARQISSIDGRVCCVCATSKGIEVSTNIIEKYTAYTEDMLKDLDSPMVDNINDVLELLVKSVRGQKFI